MEIAKQPEQQLGPELSVRGDILQVLRGAGVDFDPTYILPDGLVDTPEATAGRLVRAGILNETVTKRLGELGIEV